MSRIEFTRKALDELDDAASWCPATANVGSRPAPVMLRLSVALPIHVSTLKTAESLNAAYPIVIGGFVGMLQERSHHPNVGELRVYGVHQFGVGHDVRL